MADWKINSKGGDALRVSPAFMAALEARGKIIAKIMKKKHNLDSIEFSYPALADIFLAEVKNKKPVYKIKKTGLNQGTMEIIGWK